MTASLARGPAICVHDAMALTGESPCWDAGRGILWWIDIQGQRLLAHAAEGQNRAIPLPLMPGFVALHDSGDLWLGLENGVWRYDPESGDLDLLAKTNANPRLRLNDGKFDRRGRLWFGTMDKSGPTGGPVGALWRLDPNGTLHKMRKNVSIPNAICFAPQGDRIYFADTALARIETATLGSDGAPGPWEVLCRFEAGEHPDGAVADAEGAIWVAVVGGNRIERILPDGHRAGVVPLPVSRPTMPCFGGAGGNVLFVTSQRRFLTADDLRAQPWAGALIAVAV